MSDRLRIRYVKYGGEVCGQSDTGPKNTPAFLGTHICTDETHPGPPYRSGGPLAVRKLTIDIQRFAPFSLTWNSGGNLYYKGYMSIQPYVPSQPPPLSLAGWGAKAYSRALPTHPIYNLGVSIGELKDLPGMVNQTMRGFSALAKRTSPEAIASAFSSVRDFLSAAKSAPSAAGHTYLYGAFGLWPMLQDAMFLAEMHDKLAKKIDWLRRHNNKSVYRKFTMDAGGFSENIDRTIDPYSTVNPGLNGACYDFLANAGYRPYPVRKDYDHKIWFAGRFRYYIPELDPKRKKKPFGLSLKSHLLGLAPDPSILYKLIPWTWLLDWFTSVGSALSNLYQNAKYCVVAQYAYIMCHETFKYTAPGEITVNAGDLGDFIGRGAKYWPLHFVGESITKWEYSTREVANPYGFGITFGSLSAFQWSILVALGLSGRGNHHVRP